MGPVVELCSTKVACKELQQGTTGWILPAKCSDAVQANCASDDAGAVQNMQTGYVSCR